MGYAVMMARTRSGLASVAIRPTLRALGPYLGVQCAVTMAVFILPATVHALDNAPNAIESAAPNEQDVEQLMRDMASQARPLTRCPQNRVHQPTPPMVKHPRPIPTPIPWCSCCLSCPLVRPAFSGCDGGLPARQGRASIR